MRALRLILLVLTVAALTAPGGANATGTFKDDALGNIRENGHLGTNFGAILAKMAFNC